MASGIFLRCSLFLQWHLGTIIETILELDVFLSNSKGSSARYNSLSSQQYTVMVAVSVSVPSFEIYDTLLYFSVWEPNKLDSLTLWAYRVRIAEWFGHRNRIEPSAGDVINFYGAGICTYPSTLAALSNQFSSLIHIALIAHGLETLLVRRVLFPS